ncbi:hypothetical protein NP233_g6756 [Leucocoprinus birnbaumii]|uniref:Uncharacterized protein n=1 Tax=Leucocoprinus birnbaumii TaxID=56174 RepID=A0AAD5VQF3_9AGAR|nr:hypothetical protein NP233_g6756 [Leucocoprinus birnbaumii]
MPYSHFLFIEMNKSINICELQQLERLPVADIQSMDDFRPGYRKRQNKPQRSTPPHPSSRGVASIPSIDESVAENLNSAATEDWIAVVKWLSEICGLPDLDTKKGLRKAYNDFEAHYFWLEALYTQVEKFTMIRVGIIGLYTKMCRDHLLMERLIERGFLKRLLDLLDEQTFRQVVLHALKIMTFHNHLPIRLVVVRNAMVFIRLLEDDPSDSLAELVVPTLSFSFCAGRLDEAQTITRLFQNYPEGYDAARVVKAITRAVAHPRASSWLVARSFELLRLLALDDAVAFVDNPNSVKLMISGLSCKEWGRRLMCLQILVKLYSHESSAASPLIDRPTSVAAMQDSLDHFAKTSRPDSYMFTSDRIAMELIVAFGRAVRDSDFYPIGLKISQALPLTGFGAVGKAYGVVLSSNPPLMSRMLRWHGSSGTSITSFFVLCSKALREKDQLIAADMLDVTRLFQNGKLDQEAEKIAMRRIEQTPQEGYFYHILSSTVRDATKGLKAAKQGLKCPGLTPYLKATLLQEAVQRAWSAGLDTLYQTGCEVGDSRWYEALGLLRSALADAEIYMSEFAADTNGMDMVANLYLVLRVALTEVDPDLHEFEDTLSILRAAEGLRRLRQARRELLPDNTSQIFTHNLRQAIVQNYKESIQRFSGVIEKMASESPSSPLLSTEESLNTLTAWLNTVNLNDEPLVAGGISQAMAEKARPRVIVPDEERLKLGRCELV